METPTFKELAEEHCKNGFELAWLQNDREGALKEFRAALELWPDAPQAHCQIGQIHLFAPSPNLSEALKEFQIVARVAPDWGEGHLWCGNVLHDMERCDEAEGSYKEAARLTPNDTRPHTSLGACLLMRGKFAEAIKSLRHAITLKQVYGEIATRMMLADALRQNGQVKEALSEWETVSKMDAVWEYEQGEPERAKQLMAQFG
jgi:tetratricopeptide (TPR) repeat protein